MYFLEKEKTSEEQERRHTEKKVKEGNGMKCFIMEEVEIIKLKKLNQTLVPKKSEMHR